MSEVAVRQVADLTRQLDDLQYNFCRKMVPQGKAAELTIKFGEAWKLTLQTGDEMQRDLSYFLPNEASLLERIQEYVDKINRLKSIDGSDGARNE